MYISLIDSRNSITYIPIHEINKSCHFFGKGIIGVGN